MSRYLATANTLIIAMVCAVLAGCVESGDGQDDDALADDPATQELGTPTLLTFFQPFTTDQFGQISITGIIDIRPYAKVDMEIIQFPGNVPNMTVRMQMGKLSGTTLGAVVGSFALGTSAIIRTFNVVGPEASVFVVGGPPNTVVNIQAWLFLH
jgi:hypothetical protein